MRQMLLDSMVVKIDEEEGRHGWDQPAHLLLLMMEPLGMLGTTAAELVQVMEIPGWPQMLSCTSNIQDALSLMARAVREFPLRKEFFPVEKIYGLALVTEAWTLRLDVEGFTEEKIAELAEVAQAQKIHESPDRVESRIIQIHTMDDMVASASRIRGGELEVFKPIGDERVGGAIPVLLSQIVNEIKKE